MPSPVDSASMRVGLGGVDQTRQVSVVEDDRIPSQGLGNRSRLSQISDSATARMRSARGNVPSPA